MAQSRNQGRSSSGGPRAVQGTARAGNAAYPPAIDRLLNELARLPGVGRRSAERLAFHLLKSPVQDALALSEAIAEVKKSVHHCRRCFHFAEGDLCRLCADSARDSSTILVVEQPKDLLALEAAGAYRGVYHVLMGRISPLEGVGPEDLTVPALMSRIERSGKGDEPQVREVILGLSPSLEGDGTALYLADALRRKNVKITRLARGISAGASLELASAAVLSEAIIERRAME